MTTQNQHRHSREDQAVTAATAARPAAVTSSDGTVIGYQTLGTGEGVILIGGTLRSARDYLPLARLLARSLTVHVMDRRGRGASGPQGAGYSIEKECEDLLAVHHQTGAAQQADGDARQSQGQCGGRCGAAGSRAPAPRSCPPCARD